MSRLITKTKEKTSFTTIFKFIHTLLIWTTEKLLSFIFGSPFLILPMLILVFCFIYFGLAQPFNEPIPDNLKSSIFGLFERLGFSHFGDNTVKNVISRATNSLGFILSILSAIYFFTFREQRGISPSASFNNNKNIVVIIVLCVVIFTMIIGYALVENYESSMIQPDSLHVTKILIRKIMIWLFGLLISIAYFIDLIKILFDTMSIDKMLKSSINATSRNLTLVTKLYRHKLFNNLLEKKYKQLHYKIESIFQSLKFVADNNMNKEFEDNLKNLSEVLNKLKGENKRYKINNLSTYLLKHDKNHYIDLYNSLLRNTLSLINHLYKNQQYNKGKSLVNLYYSIYIDGEDRLKQYFIFSLKEFLDSIDINNERQLYAFLDGLGNIADQQTLVIYKNLIMKLVVHNNLKMLTNIVYDFKDNVPRKFSTQIKPRTRLLVERGILGSLRNSIIVILMQCLVKSIEISHYSITGFLVKYLVTNFEGVELKKGFSVLKKNPYSFTKVFEHVGALDTFSHNKIDTELIGINKTTFDYCCKKLCILVYGQQLYSHKNKLWFVQDTDKSLVLIEIGKEFRYCTYSEYILNKVRSASYGLLFFDDGEIMDLISQGIKNNKQ